MAGMRTDGPRTRLAALAQAQQGLFTRGQAGRCGYSAYQIRRRVQVGEWCRVLGPVLACAGVVCTPALRDRAAQLALPYSVLTGPSAVRRYGIDPADRGTYAIVAPQCHPRLTGVRLMRERVPDDDVEYADGLLLTCRARALVDCLRVLPEPVAVHLLDEAIRQRWFTPDQLAARARGLVGRRGAPRVARLSGLAGSGAQSTAERRATALLRRARVRGWRANVEITDGRRGIAIGDIVFEARRLVVKIDGRARHATAAQFEHDRERQNRLVAAGWTVLRFTWRDLVDRPAYVVATIEGMIGVRGAHR